MDGKPVGQLENNRRTVIYVSPYFVMRDGGFTKHYFAGTQRVLSKLGTGRFNNRFSAANRTITAGNKNYIQRQQQLQRGIETIHQELQLPGAPTARPPQTEGGRLPTVVGDYTIPSGWPRAPHVREPGGLPGAPIQWGAEITNDNVRAGYTYISNSLFEQDQFFFHPDHLGSTAIVTDRHGNITQFIAYLPFGQNLISEHTTRRGTSLLFSAHEFDSETGLYYMRARYYDPRIAIFYGVDPLWELFPHVGVYVYVMGNPIMLFDPDGMAPRSRIQYRGDGVFGMNMGNMSSSTQREFNIANNNTANWGPNEIGINTTVRQITPVPTVGVDPQHTSVRTVGENARSTSQPDRRVGRDIPTVGGGGRARGGGIAMMLINTANTAYNIWSGTSGLRDRDALFRQTQMLELAFDLVDRSKRDGFLDPVGHLSINDIGSIVNVVFQGVNDTGNPNITTIGNSILERFGRYDSQTQTHRPLILMLEER